MELTRLLQNPGPALTRAEIGDYERRHSVAIPEELAEYLVIRNGGHFPHHTLLPVASGFISLRDLCRLQEGHGDDIANLLSLLASDDQLPAGLIPAVTTYCGNFLVMPQAGGGVFWWEHETGDLTRVGDRLADIVPGLQHEPDESEFETRCQTATLHELRQTSYFNGHRNEICQEAARQGNSILVAECLDTGLPPGRAMRFAAMNGHFAIVGMLMRRGMDLNAVDDSGKTVLDWLEWKPEYHARLREMGARSAAAR